MEQLPRETNLSKSLAVLTRDGLLHLFEDPPVRARAQHLCILLRFLYRCTPQQYQSVFLTAPSMLVILSVVCSVSPELFPLCDAYAESFGSLVALVKQREPDLADIWGPFLAEFLTVVLYLLIGLKPPATWGQRVFHLAPGVPIEIRSNDDIAHYKDATPAHRKMLDQYFASLELRRKPGPEPGCTTRPPDFPDQVRRAYETLLNARDADPFIGVEDVMKALKHQGKRTFERWLKESTGVTWKSFKSLLHRWLKEAPKLTWDQFKRTL